MRSALRRGLLPCVSLCIFMLLGLFVTDLHAATYHFNGGDVLGCARSDKVYTCSSTRMPGEYDKVVIDSGYTVQAQSDVVFSWNQGLTMSGTARLTSTGSINLSGLNPANLVVNGGSFGASGRFTVTGANPFKADVSAGALTLGSGSTLRLSGTMTSRGDVSVGSNTTIDGSISGAAITTNSPFTITGAVTASGTLLIASGGVIGGAVSGTVVTANSPVTLKGDITASTRFILGSGSTVNGNITAPEVDLYSAGSSVTGNVTASKSLVLGSSVKVKGTVDTGKLTLQASDATIEGVAKVDFATLYSSGRVTGGIVCKQGTAPGKCDCVDNQSGFPVNSAKGPTCESGKSSPGVLDHFLITHDASAGTCTSNSVEVTACADPACAQKYTNPTQVVMQPGNATTTISGTGNAQVSSAIKGGNLLSLTTKGTASSFRCLNRQTGATDCKVEFTGDVNFDVRVPDHKAGESVSAILQAMKPNADKTACVPAFSGARMVTFSCGYSQPGSGTMEVLLDGTQALACSPDKTAAMNAVFDDKAQATIALSYPDAGKVKLNAASNEITGSGEFVVAPYKFGIAAPIEFRAGQPFDVGLSALNKNDNVTPNFNRAYYADANATRTTLRIVCNKHETELQPLSAVFGESGARIPVTFPEAGYIGLRAELTGFLGSALQTASETRDPGSNACANVGPFVPMYFQVELGDAARMRDKNGKDATYYYSRETMPLRITAMNAQGNVTTDYPSDAYGKDHIFTLSAVGTDGKPLAPGIGTLAGTLKASDFENGVAKVLPTRPSPQATFQFAQVQTAPTKIRLRVENGKAGGIKLPDADFITSADGNAYADKAPEKARPEIRSGRLRLGTVSGGAGSALELPVNAEYWSGKSWLLNDLDDFTAILAGAIAQSAYPARAGQAAPGKQALANVKLGKGKGTLVLQSAAAGWIDIAFNLGNGTLDQSCLSAHPASTGAKINWLQAAGACIDPSGRATFGIAAPESKRLIHVREVFN